MAAADEIAIKLGIKVGEFNAALADANASVKKLKKEGEGDFFGGFKSAKKSVNDLKDALVAGGIATAVVSFFNAAIEAANKSTDATNKNAAAVREFGKGIEEIKSVGANVAVATVGFFNRIGSSIGDLINTTVAFTKGGLAGALEQEKVARVVEETAKAADAAERRLAEVRKKNGAEFLAITKELADIEKKSQEQKLKGADAQTTELNLVAKMTELRTKAATVENDAIERRRVALDIAKTQLALDEANLAAKKENQAVIAKIAEEEKRHADILAKNLSNEERISKLRRDVADAEFAVISATGNALKTNEAILALKKAQNALSEEEQRILIETNKQRSLGGDLDAQLFLLRKKNSSEGIADEKERLTVITLQNQELLVQRNISELLAKESARGGLSIEEKAILNSLQEQQQTIAAMIVQRQTVNRIVLDSGAATAKATASEKEALAVLELQAAKAENLAKQKDILAKIQSETVTPAETATLELLRQQSTQLDLQIVQKQKISLGIKEDLELFVLQQKNAAALTESERLRKEELILQTKEKILQKEIEVLYGKLMDNTITPAEKEQLNQLIKQSQEIGKQITAKQDLSKFTTGQQLPAEEKITGSYREQIGMIGDIITEKDKAIFKAAGVQLQGEQRITEELKEQLRLAEARANVRVSVTQEGDIGNLNNAALKELILKLEKDIAFLQATTTTGFKSTPEILILQNALANATKELDLRKDFERVSELLGSGKAEVQFGSKTFDRLSQLLNPDLQKQTANGISNISTILSRVFPDAALNIRTPTLPK